MNLPGGAFDLRAPADITVTRLTSTKASWQTTGDHGITFALCEDVFGYFLHVNTLVPELAEIFTKVDCPDPETPGYQHCSLDTNYEVKAGALLGQVGVENPSNFDFGAYDFRTRLDYANPSRYGHPNFLAIGRVKSWSVICPLDLFDEPPKEILYDKLERTGEPRCGEVMQDVAGTLQGNWYNDDTSDSDNTISFVFDNIDSTNPVISVAGILTSPGYWKFTPTDSGLVNRHFSEITADGNIYCYQGLETVNFGFENVPGRIVAQLVSDTELMIEHQAGSCIGDYEFISPLTYNR